MFHWYITTLEVEDFLTHVCIDNLRKYSLQTIEKILVPLHYYKDQNRQIPLSFLNVPVKAIDTTIAGKRERKFGRVKVKRNNQILRVNEEHFRLIGHGVSKFPACIIDSDIWIMNNQIDSFVEGKKNGCLKHRSSMLFLHSKNNLWSWDRGNPFDKDLPQGFKFKKEIPFIHFINGSFILTKRRGFKFLNQINNLMNFIFKNGITQKQLNNIFQLYHNRNYLNNFLILNERNNCGKKDILKSS